MKVKVLLFFFISSISLVSCKEKSANDLFESFVHKKLMKILIGTHWIGFQKILLILRNLFLI